jgi:hypothetical protein
MLVLLGLGLFALTFPSPRAATIPNSGSGRIVLSADARPTAVAAAAGTLVLVASATDARSDSEHVAARAAASDAEDRALAAALRGAVAIEMRGGTWLAWYEAAHTGRHELAWARALRSAHAAGAEVRASGGAAAWIAQASPVPRARIGKPAQDPHDDSLDVPVEGLGLFDAAFVGVSNPAEPADFPTADRVLERAVAYGYRDVLLLAGAAEFAWDPQTRRARVSGPESDAPDACARIVWLDMQAGKRSREVVTGVRANFLRAGDEFDARTRSLVGGVRAEEEAPCLDAWKRELLADASSPGAAQPPAGREPQRPIRALSWSRDERTLRTPQGGLGGVVLDFEFSRP